MGVVDQLLATGNDAFNVIGSGSIQLTIAAIGPRRFFTLQNDFVEFLRTISFVSDDQAAFVERNITLVVQEHPLEASPPSMAAVIPVVFTPVNDRPIIASTQRLQATLTDYLPVSSNEGFNVSYFLNESDVQDVDRVSPSSPDFVGLAIIAYTGNDSGSWMIWVNGTWLPLPPVHECSPKLVPPDGRIRFVPNTDPSKADTQASLSYRAWDGTEVLECVENNRLFLNHSALSAENRTFTYDVEYLNCAPTVLRDQYALPSIEEDESAEGLVVSNIAVIVGEDSDDLSLGLAVVSADTRNGIWQYRDEGSWNDFQAHLSPEWSLLLHSESQVRFLPNADYFGLATFSALLWDMSGSSTNTTTSDPYTGTFSVESASVSINVTSINDQPVIELGVEMVKYTEGGSAIQIFRNLSIQDVDSTELAWALVILECPLCWQDKVSGDGSGSGFVVSLPSNSTDIILTRHAPPNFLTTVERSDSVRVELRVRAVADTDNSPEQFARYLQSLYFTSTSREPSSAPREVSLSVSDGLNESDSATLTVAINLINDESPVVILPYASITWVEDSGLLQLFNLSAVEIVDLDDNSLESATLELQNHDPAYESLQVNCSTFGLTCSFWSGVLTLIGQQDIDVYQQAFREVFYNNTHPEPVDNTREVYISVFDGLFSSPVVHLIIEVELINDQTPVIALAQQVVVFQEPDTNPITTRVRVAPGANITDSDLGIFPLHSATLTIVDPQNDEKEGLLLPSGALQINISYTDQFQHSLTLSSQGGVPLLTLQDALQVVEYFNTAEQMDTVNRTIEIVVSDILTLSGIQMSAPVQVRVDYIPVDDLPEVVLRDNILLYSEGQVPEQLHVAIDAEIVDVDSVEVSRLEIQLTANITVDTLQERLQINLTGFESLITQLPSNSSTLINLTGVASVDDYTSVIRTLTYQHLETPGNPDTGVRTITATPFSSRGEPGIADMVMVAFSAVNNAPVIDLNGDLVPGLDNTVFFQEESPLPVQLLAPGMFSIVDVDDEDLLYMKISLLNALDSELESITVGDIPVSLDVGEQNSILLELTGQPSPISDFEAVLSNLTYHNLADEPNTLMNRRVSVEVMDGKSSGYAEIEIIITPRNDAPDIILIDTEIVYVEEQTVAIAAAVQVFDPDSNLVEYRVRPVTAFTGDVISGPALSFAQELGGVYIASLTPTSPDDTAALLAEITFTSNTTEPMTSDRVFCISVRDEEMAASREACVTVEIQVINDNAPVFVSSLQASVVEERPNEVVTQVNATDLDSANSNVTLVYSITAGDDCISAPHGSGSGGVGSGPLIPEEKRPCRFDIDSLTGEVTTTSAAPNREERDSYTLTVTVSDGEFSSSAELVVAVDDVNDVAPVFVPDSYEETVPVGAQAGYVVVQLNVYDPDLNDDFSVILFTMDPNIDREIFALDQNIPGRVFLNRPENELASSVSQYTLTFLAIDSLQNESPNVATVIVNITQNLEPPVFGMTSYTAMVSEAASNGTLVLTVTANDSDPGYHGHFTFSVPDEVPFAVDPVSGVISVSDSSLIDFEMMQEYVFSVVATDTGRPQMSSSVEIKVSVVNVNDNSPVFDADSYEVGVCEGVPIGYAILELSAQDMDGDALSYDLIVMSGCLGCVAVNSSTGQVAVAREIDFEEQQTFSFSVLVNDGINFVDVVATVNVLNDNEAAPEFKFESLSIEIPETQETGSILPFPMAYIPLASDTDTCSVDQCDGILVIINETCDVGSGLQYSITSGNEEGLFEIHPSNGLISVSQDLDFDIGAHREFNLSLTVWDGLLNDTAYLTIIIVDINDNLPDFLNDSYSATVPEDTPVGTTIITTLAIDMDPTDILRYSLIAEENPGYFTINENGEVETAVPLDFETISRYSLVVAVTDRPSVANATAVLALLTVDITDVNDVAPQFTEAEYRFTTLENTPPEPIGTVLALDQDPVNVTLLYSIVNVTPSVTDGDFVIDSVSGLLESNTEFDRENQSSYVVTVQVVDNGMPSLSSTALVVVEIEDVNESPPVFSDDTPSSVNISESADVNTSVLTLDAFDSDNTTPENSVLGFRIVSGDDASTFSLTQVNAQTVQLILLQELDYEMVMQYNLVVEVFDMANAPEGMSLSSTTEIEVMVIDENDNSPEFTEALYSAEIPEFSAVGTSVLQVQAFDIDTNINAVIVYSIVESGSDDFPFSIDPTTGIITVANTESLNINLSGRQLTLTVTASNPNTALQNSTIVVVDLIDINDNAPFFPPSEFIFYIAEDFTPVGQTARAEGSGDVIPPLFSGTGSGEALRRVTTITAFDLDEGTNAELRFSLTTGSDKFFIDPLEGDLFVIGTLDREEQDAYSIDVRVTDMGTPALENVTSVQVIVTDINDNAPIFQQQNYSGSVLENQTAGIDVLQLSTSDSDIGENADIQFLVLNSSSPFRVNPQSGLIQTTRALDREAQASWSFQVQATDGELSTTADITISVEDENDHTPTISPREVRANLTENTNNGTVIQTFTISDADSGVNAESTLFFRATTDLFSIDDNGVLTVAGLIDYEMIESVTLEVVVRNVAPPHFEATAQVMVAVENENDNQPVIHFGAASVQYDEVIRQRILNIGITIVDGDGQEATRLVDGIVQFVSEELLEPSFAYEPVTSGEIAPDFGCSLEVNKMLKFSPCGIPGVTVLSRYAPGILELRGGLTVNENVVGDSIVLDASQQQYASYIGNVGTLNSNGLTISTWVWFEPIASTELQTILSKISSSQLLYGIFCNSDGSLEFRFTSNSTAQSAVFSGGCSALEGAWHHLGLVVDNSDPSQWRLNVLIDGKDFESADIPQPYDSISGFLIGASRSDLNSPTTNFFNGRLHMLAVSLSSSSRNELNCVIGCGLVLVSLEDSPLTHYYDFSQRALIFEGTHPIGPYEDFLNSLTLVLPFTEPRVSEYILSYTVQDEVFNCLPAFLPIILIPSNDYRPELSLNGDVSRDYSTTFIEEAGPVALVNTTSFYLTDMDFVAFNYVVTARIVDALQPYTDEVLAVRNVPEGMNVSYASNHTLTLTGMLILPMFQTVVRTLSYDNTADEPVGTTRQVMVTVFDPPLLDVSALSNVSITFVNDPPELLMVASLTEYSEGDGAVPILESATVSDSDSSFLVSATITFTPLDAEMEVLSANSTNTAITTAYNSTSARLTLTGEDTLENYTAVILSITYEHIGIADPSLGTRVFTFVLSDGESEGEPELVMLFFAAVNDGPVVNLNGGSSAGFNYRVDFDEDVDETVSIVSPNATIIDVDGDGLVSLSVNLTNPEQDQESIIIPTPSNAGIRVSYVSDSLVQLYPASGISSPLSDFEAVLRTVQYRNAAEEPTPGIRTVRFLANDGEDFNLPALTEINIIPSNDRPELDLDTERDNGTGFVADSFVEGGSSVYITARTVSLMDNDVNAAVDILIITIQGALDGLDERIESTDPNVTLPLPANGQSVTYLIDFSGEQLALVTTLLTSLQYRNTRLEPTPGERVITVAVSDGVEFSNTAVVTLEVVGLNENVPEFTMDSYTFMVNESLPAPTPVGDVTAVDIDDGIDGEIRYEIVASDPLEGLAHFTIDSITGRILTAVTLDREAIRSYDLTISARDGGLPLRTANAIVTIQVGDINDNPPLFSPDNNFNLTVLESRGVGYVVETILVTDPDSGPVASLIQLQTTGVPFAVDIVSGVITVDGDLDLDSQAAENCSSYVTYVLEVEARDFYSSLFSTAFFTIRVVDVNDNEPEFVSGSTFTADENNEDLYLFTVSVVDRDCTSNGEITFSFQNSSTYGLFNIHQSTGDISSLVPLDREEREFYEFTVSATDGGMPSHTVSTVVTLQLTDLNDNPPVFSESQYEIETAENVMSGTRLFDNIAASDIDIGDNGQVASYSLSSVPVDPLTNEPFFTINQFTGDIYFSHVPSSDYEFESNVTLTVFAEDAGSPPLTGNATVTIFVIDINDNAPELLFSSTQAEVPENEPGFLVTTFSATDADSGQNGEVFFRLLNENDTFTINQTTGDLTTISGLDFEDKCSYLLYVQAYDGGIPSLSSQVDVFAVLVQPVEDVDPMFTFDAGSSYQTSVPENSPMGTVVIRVTAEDGDLNECSVLGSALYMSGSGSGMRSEGRVVYSFSESSEIFMISESTGEISLLQPLDYEEMQQYFLTVLATDSAGMQAQEMVTITVLDRNDHTPQFQQPFYEMMVSENTTVGSPVLQVSATDVDSLDQGRLVYSLTNNPSVFAINGSDGVVYVAGDIDFDGAAGTVVTFSAVVNDSASNTDTVPVTITIVDINDLPPVINTQPETLIFTEGQVRLQPFPTMTVSDRDSFQHLCSARVMLNSTEQANTGPLDQCVCTDPFNASSCTAGCLEFIQLSPDSFPGSIQQLQEGFELLLEGLYSIDEYERALESIEYVNTIVNPEPQLRTISVSVFDCQLASNTLIQSIDVQPINVFPPLLDLNGDTPGINYQSSFTERGNAIAIVSENVSISDDDTAAVDQVLTSIDVRLTNQQDELESITLGSQLPEGISVHGNSTYLTLSGVASLEDYTNSLRLLRYSNLAREPSPTPRVVEFTAHEFFLSSSTAYTEITVTTINDFPPSVIASPPRVNYITTYTEGSAGVGVVSTDAVINDEDSTNDNVTEMQVFIISATSEDRLFLASSLGVPSPSILFDQISDSRLSFNGSSTHSDYEAVLRNIQYQFRGDEFVTLFPPRLVFIQIADHSLSGFTVIQVELSPVNDHLPEFTEESISVSVPENATVGTSVYQIVEYTDADTFSPTEVNFHIVDGNVFFSIAPDSGIIILEESLDYETTPAHSFTVELADEGLINSTASASIEVTVIVTDHNDHVPMFTQEIYNATINEDAPIGSPVLQVSANDRDSQMHSLLVFDVINTTDFTVDMTGTVYTNVHLDQEAVPSYQFLVSVQNPGNVAFDTAAIFITVLDINDHAPSVTLSPDSATLQEPQTLVPLSSFLTITDGDTNPSLDYAIVEILEVAPGTLIATLYHPGITVVGNQSKSLVFSGTSQSLSNYEQVLRGVVYEDSAEEPLPVTREIAYQVGSEPGLIIALNYTPSETTSNVTVLQVSVKLINDQAPEIQLDARDPASPPPGCTANSSYSTTFTEDAPPVRLSNNSLSITDSDSGNTTLSWAMVELLQATDGELESLHYQPSGSIVLNTSASSNTRLMLQGPASIAEFEAALHTVAYQSLSQEPTDTRHVEFTVNDGQNTSPPALACIQLVEVNDPPVLTLGANASVDAVLMYTEGQTEGLLLAEDLQLTGRLLIYILIAGE